MTVGFVYAVACDNLIKIGFSTEPAKRLRRLKARHGSRAKMIGFVKGSMSQEKKLHALLRPWAVRGEWYPRNLRAIEFFVSQVRRPERVGDAPASDIHPLKAYRCARGLTIFELAERLGVSDAALSRWENRKRAIRASLWARIHTETGIPVEELATSMIAKLGAA